MFVRFYGACALTIALLTSCGGEKAENKTDKKEEAKTEAPEKKPEAEQKPEAPAEKDLASQLIGKWEMVKYINPGGEEEKGFKITLILTKTGFTRITQSPGEAESYTNKGTWTLDASKKDAEETGAIDCIIFKDELEHGSVMPENVMPIKDDMLTLTVHHPMPATHIYKRK